MDCLIESAREVLNATVDLTSDLRRQLLVEPHHQGQRYLRPSTLLCRKEQFKLTQALFPGEVGHGIWGETSGDLMNLALDAGKGRDLIKTMIRDAVQMTVERLEDEAKNGVDRLYLRLQAKSCMVLREELAILLREWDSLD